MAAPGKTNVLFEDIQLQSSLVETWLFGVYTCIFAITMYGLLFRYRGARVGSNFFITLVTVTMYALSTTHLALRWNFIRQAFVQHGTDGPTVTAFLSKSPIPFRIGGATVFSVNTLIADSLFIWRAWQVWGRDWRVVVLPILVTILGTIFSALGLAQQAAQAQLVNPTSRLISFGAPYFATSLATVCISTILIVYRLLSVRQFVVDDGQGSSTGVPLRKRDRLYTTVIEIIVESAALYTFSLAIFLAFFVRSNLDELYLQQILAQITGIAPTLIVMRVSLGLARPDTAWTGDKQKVSTMQFTHGTTNGTGTTQLQSTLADSDPEKSGGTPDQEKSRGTADFPYTFSG